jgi:two-component system NarL family sensor kinase
MVAEMKGESDTEKLRRRNRELSILNSIAQALNREVDLSQALHTTLAQVAELLDLQTGWIWLLREDTCEPYLVAAQNLPPALANSPERMDGSDYCYCLEAYQAGDLDTAANVSIITCTRLKGLVAGTDGLRYHATIPLYAHGKSLGVLNVASADWRRLSPDDLRLLYTVGDLLSIAIERARLFSRTAEFGAAEERNRLAREIHDTLAQGLAAITLQLETADALLEGGADAQRTRQPIQNALALARANLEEARRSVLDLRAAPLEGRTLPEALAALAEEYAKKSKLELAFTTTGENRALPFRVEASLYRIAQEALNNVNQHASAKQLTVTLGMQPDQVTLLIEDDGRGFDPSQTPEGRYGLIGLNERARLLGGTFELCSTPGSGTRIQVTIPLKD